MALSLVHTLFDVLAALSAFVATYAVYRWRLRKHVETIGGAGMGYAMALLAGAAIGGFALGTLNLQLSGIPGIGRSVIGALGGAIAGVELFKLARGMRGSTGIVFVPGFATSVVIGRLGCYFAGLDDHTAGIATSVPWGHDFGDGILRHPVQLYESLAMLAFVLAAIGLLARRDAFFLRNGFYMLVFWYAAQRFVWEFLKPYAPLWGALNVFHFTALALMIYAMSMMLRTRVQLAMPGRGPAQ